MISQIGLGWVVQRIMKAMRNRMAKVNGCNYQVKVGYLRSDEWV